MHSRASLTAAALLLLTAATATAQLQDDNQREQFLKDQESQLQLREEQAVTLEQKLAVEEARRALQFKQQQQQQVEVNQQIQQQKERFELQKRQEIEEQKAEAVLRGANLAQRQAHSDSGDILDAILVNGTLASLSDENIARFLDTESSVNSLAGCFAGPETCFSEGAHRLVNELLALQPGTLCLECQPGEEERLNEVIYQMVSGLSTRYPKQWSIIFPQIFSTIAAFQARLAAQQQ